MAGTLRDGRGSAAGNRTPAFHEQACSMTTFADSARNPASV